MVNEAIGAVQGPKTTKISPVSLLTSAAGKIYSGSITTYGDPATIAGFNFINPYGGDGYNNITANLDPLAPGNGFLNRHGKYNKDGKTPTCSFMRMA